MENGQKRNNFGLRRGAGRRWLGLIIMGAVFLALAAGATMFFMRGGFGGADDDKAIAKRVGEHIILPDEEPSITTIEKAGELSSQPFFADAEDGDKILIYPKSARIIIYRPSENILVNVGPIVDDNATTTTE